MLNTIKHIYSTFLTKYKSEPPHYNKTQIENVLTNRSCKISTFTKESTLLTSYNEYLKSYYTFPSINEHLHKYITYYKNYLQFFCKPTFRHSKLNNIIQRHGEKKAETYYNRKYKHKKHMKINNDKVFTDTIKRNINKRSKCYNNHINNAISKETIKLNDDNDFNTIINHSIIKDNSILSILNAFNINNKNNSNSNSNTNTKSNTFVIRSCNTNLLSNTTSTSSSSNAFGAHSKRFNSNNHVQQRKSNLKLMSQLCLMKSQYRNSNSNTHMKFPPLHIRVQTDSNMIRMNNNNNNTKHVKVNTFNEINGMNVLHSYKQNGKRLLLLTSSSRNNTIQQRKQNVTSFNRFDIQQSLLNKNKKCLLKVDGRNRNSEYGNMFRTINGSELKVLKGVGCDKKGVYKGRNVKEGKYSLNRNRIKRNDGVGWL